MGRVIMYNISSLGNAHNTTSRLTQLSPRVDVASDRQDFPLMPALRYSSVTRTMDIELKQGNSDSPESRRSFESDNNEDAHEQEGDNATDLAATDKGKQRWYSPALDVENKGSAAR